MERKTFSTIDSNKKDVELAIISPNQNILNDADIKYHAAISKAVIEGVMTRNEVIELVKKRGIWSEQSEQEIEDIHRQIKECEKKILNKSTTEEQGIKIAKEIKKLRETIIEKMGKLQSYLEITAEKAAENIKDHYIVAMCTVYADSGEKYFADYEDYCQRNEEIAAKHAYIQYIYHKNGLDSNFEDTFFENKYLKEKGAMNEKGYFVDKETGLMVSEDGHYIDENFNYITKDGKRCDKYGNLIDEETGELIIEEQVSSKKKPKSKKD